MNVTFQQSFQRKAEKLTLKQKNKTRDRIRLFRISPFDPLLNNHSLTGTYEGYCSINIASDLRAIYRPISPSVALFVAHSELYK